MDPRVDDRICANEAKAQDIIELTSLPTLGELYEPGCQRHREELQSIF